MSSLYDRVSIERRFSRSARLDADLNGTPPLVGYVLQSSTKKVIETLAASQTESKQGAFTWTGPYGTGKSSAALLLANLVGGSRANREIARKIAGPGLVQVLAKAFPDRLKPWKVVPVTGSRTELRRAVVDASAKSLGWSRAVCERAGKSDKALIMELLNPRSAGVLLLIDELGKFLEHSVASNADIHLLQDLGEASSRSKGRLVVVGILHQAFDAYADRLSRDSRKEWAKVQGRFQDVAFLAGADETVALLGRAISADRTPAKANANAVKVAEAVAKRRPTNKVELATALSNTWPLNPVTALLLGPVSRQRFAQNERSVFGFLSSVEPFGFLEFLKKEGATSSSTYGPDRLWDYLASNFGLALASGVDSARFSLAFEAIEKAGARGSALDVSLAKSAAAIELFRNGSGLAVSDDFLQCCVPTYSSSEVSASINSLVDWAILLRQPRLGGYAMFAGSDFDLDAAIAKTKSRISPQQLTEIPTEVGHGFVVAKRHYFRTGVLRAFEVVLQSVASRDNISAIADRLAARAMNSSGVMVLALPGDELSKGDLEKSARDLAVGLQERQVIAAVTPVIGSSQIGELAGDLITLARIAKEHPQLEGDRIARREIAARRSLCINSLQTEIGAQLEHGKWWLGPAPEKSVREKPAVLATLLADAAYPATPVLLSELVQRDRPSSNAMAAVRELTHAMVEKANVENLGMDGYPAEMGLYLTVLKPFGLHRASEDGSFAFREPDRSALGRSLRPIFKLLTDAKSITLHELYKQWEGAPYGLKQGVMPILALAAILSVRDRFAVYLDGIFQTGLDKFFVDKLLQNPSSIRLQAINRSREDEGFLESLSTHLGAGSTGSALSVAQTLFQRYRALPEYAKRTDTLSDEFAAVRAQVLKAEDPEALLFKQLSSLNLGENKAETIVKALKSAEQVFPRMLQELRVKLAAAMGVDPETYAGLKARAALVVGLSSDLRFDALANRAAAFEGAKGTIEEFASLLVHKPASGWTDKDADQAFLEIARFGRKFRELEALAAVQKRTAISEAVALVVGLDSKKRPLLMSFELTSNEKVRAGKLATELLTALKNSQVSESIQLAAIARAIAVLSSAHEELAL